MTAPRRNPDGVPMHPGLARALRLVREFTGESKWDDYLADCTRRGVKPLSRKEFERHRADRKEHRTEGRCC